MSSSITPSTTPSSELVVNYSTDRLFDARKKVFPTYISNVEFREEMKKYWNSKSVSTDITNSHQKDTDLPTMPVSIVNKAGDIIGSFLKKTGMSSCNILEIMAGNCGGSRILLNRIRKCVTINNWYATDVINFPKTIKEREITFTCLHGLDAVSKFYDMVDVLLLMCPPPNSLFLNKECTTINILALCDFYSIDEFIKLAKKEEKEKYIVFIGELGASDGTEGMYNYMIFNDNLCLEIRETIYTGTNMYGLIQKEVFVFRVKI